jgi:hypothetical protein
MRHDVRVRLGAPEIVYQDEALQLAAIGELFVERWTGVTTVERMQRLIEAHQRFLLACAPARTLHLVVLSAPQVVVPDAAIRRLVDERTRAIDPHLDAAALVVASTGFASAALRATISAASLLRRARYPFRVFATKLEALPWLAQQRGDDGAALASAYAALERELIRREPC